MSRITLDLIRKKAEHNDGLLSDLEEISLHQLEIEKIEVIGRVCRKLRILYLQNNIISKIEDLHHLKELQYLNLALNNITKIENLSSCESLSKLDLTVNFVDLEDLEESIISLKGLINLKELFLMGNPCMEWENCREFIIASLPQLRSLDSREITHSERIVAEQNFPERLQELRQLALENPEKKQKIRMEQESKGGDSSPYTPESRMEMYKEIAQQKEEEEIRKHGIPKKTDEEKHHIAVKKALEEEGVIRNRNEAKVPFHMQDEDGKGNIVIEVDLPRFLDTSLVAADVHPTFVRIIIKGKILQLVLPEEVNATESIARRSTTTGSLVITCPKLKCSEAAKRMARNLSDSSDRIENLKPKDTSRVKRLSGKKPSMRELMTLALDNGEEKTEVLIQERKAERKETDLLDLD